MPRQIIKQVEDSANNTVTDIYVVDKTYSDKEIFEIERRISRRQQWYGDTKSFEEIVRMVVPEAKFEVHSLTPLSSSFKPFDRIEKCRTTEQFTVPEGNESGGFLVNEFMDGQRIVEKRITYINPSTMAPYPDGTNLLQYEYYYRYTHCHSIEKPLF